MLLSAVFLTLSRGYKNEEMVNESQSTVKVWIRSGAKDVQERTEDQIVQ